MADPTPCQTDIEKYRRAFDTLDPEGKGYINVDQLHEVATKLGYKLQPEIYRAIIKSIPVEGAAISFDQFLQMVPLNTMDIPKEQHKLADLQEKFQRYDLDHNGSISLSEAQWALQMELGVSCHTALRLLSQFIKLDYEQFVEFYGKVQQKKLDIYETFAKYDRNHDGMISVDEAHQVLHQELGFNEEKSKAMISRYDLNKDGRVSYLEFAEFYVAVEDRKNKISQTFHEFDKDKAGFVSMDQARQILKGYLGFSDDKTNKTLDVYDINKDGKIDYQEFAAFYSMIEEERQRLLLEFERFDTDNDRKVSFQEFQELLNAQGYADREIEALMAIFDVNKDGYLSFEEFKKFLNFK